MNYIAWYFQEIKRNKHLDTIKCGTKSVPRSVMLFVTLKLPNYEKRRSGWIPRKCGTHGILWYPTSENTIRAKCLVFVANQPSRGLAASCSVFYHWKLFQIAEITIRTKYPWNSCLHKLRGVHPRRVMFSIIENNFKLLKLPSVLNILGFRAYTNPRGVHPRRVLFSIIEYYSNLKTFKLLQFYSTKIVD